MTNPSLGLEFIILYDVQGFFVKQMQQLCSLLKDNIVYKDVKQELINFESTFLISKWIVTTAQDKDQNNYYIKLYDSSFNLIKSYLLGKSYSGLQSAVYSDTLLINSNNGRGEVILFDMTSPNPDDFKVRSMFTEYFYNWRYSVTT